MYTPHTVTVYNVTTETGPDFEDVTKNNITVLKGVFLAASKGTNVRQSGLEGADAVILHIPFSVDARDGLTGQPKTYAPPVEYWRSEDKSGLWTLSVGRQTFFIKGEVISGSVKLVSPLDYDGTETTDSYLIADSTINPEKDENASEELINFLHDGVYTVTKVDEMDYGSPAMQHWEVGGV